MYDLVSIVTETALAPTAINDTRLDRDGLYRDKMTHASHTSLQ